MYELGMSSDGRKEPFFESNTPNQSVSSLDEPGKVQSVMSAPIYMEEEPEAGVGAILMRSGIVIAFALAAFGGYKFHQGTQIQNEIAGQGRTDWAGRPLATNEQGSLVWPDDENARPRNIDLTKTGSIDSNRKSKVIEAKPVPVGNKLGAGTGFHIVKSGDTLSAIAKAYNVRTAEIVRLNDISNPRAIKPGMKLILSK